MNDPTSALPDRAPVVRRKHTCTTDNSMPKSRADLTASEATLAELLDRYHDHVFALLVGHEAPAVIAGHALSALATSQVIVDDLLSERAAIARSALDSGATPEQLQLALGGSLVSVLDAIVERVWDGPG